MDSEKQEYTQSEIDYLLTCSKVITDPPKKEFYLDRGTIKGT